MATSIKNTLASSPLLLLVQKKSRPEKCPFVATNNWIVITVKRCVKYFAPNSPFFQKSHGGKKKRGNYEELSFSRKRKKIFARFFLVERLSTVRINCLRHRCYALNSRVEKHLKMGITICVMFSFRVKGIMKLGSMYDWGKHDVK